MSLPTEFGVKMVSDLFFRRFKELSIRSLKELKDGNRRPELRLVRVSSELGPSKNVFPGALTSRFAATVPSRAHLDLGL